MPDLDVILADLVAPISLLLSGRQASATLLIGESDPPTMGSVSSALNAMANWTVTDLWRALGSTASDAAMLRVSRLFTIVWRCLVVGGLLPLTHPAAVAAGAAPNQSIRT